VKKVRKVSALLGAPIAVGYKVRSGPDQSELTQLAGDVAGKVPIIIEDMITTGGSVSNCIDALLLAGCRPEVYVAATHGLFVGEAPQRLVRPEIAEVVTTDSLPIPPERRFKGLTVVSVADLVAAAIHHSHNDQSVSSLFE
jgi:ribose-phosphate pyrophosphokinase